MGNELYNVSPRDPLAFGLACFVMAMSRSAPFFMPAWRAARINPVQALRT